MISASGYLSQCRSFLRDLILQVIFQRDGVVVFRVMRAIHKSNPTTSCGFQQGFDKIDILGYGGAPNKFGDLAGHISQVGADTHINLGGVVAGAGSIILQNTQMGSLSSSDFAFK